MRRGNRIFGNSQRRSKIIPSARGQQAENRIRSDPGIGDALKCSIASQGHYQPAAGLHSFARGALEFCGPARLDKLNGKALRLEISGHARRGGLRTARSRGRIHQDQGPGLRQVIQGKPQGRSMARRVAARCRRFAQMDVWTWGRIRKVVRQGRQMEWCRRGESNPRPRDYETLALPLSYAGTAFNHAKESLSEVSSKYERQFGRK